MKKLIIHALFVTLFLISNPICARCLQPGLFNQSVGTAATAKDKYRIICPAGTKSFQAQVRDQPPIVAPIVYINITSSSLPGSTDRSRPDTIDGNGGTSQCDLFLDPPGFGSFSKRTLTNTSPTPVTFDMEVYKSAAGAEIYSVNEFCKSASGVDLGHSTNVQILQNQ